MIEKHTCKICSSKVSQLQKHLTMKHNLTKLDDYLREYNCGEEYTRINMTLRQVRAKNSPWSVEYYVSRGKTISEAKQLIDKKKETRKKQKTTPSDPSHWVAKGFSHDDAVIRAEKYKKDIGSMPSLEKFIIRFGQDHGTKKWQEYQYKISNRQQTFLSKASDSIKEAKLIRWFNTSKTENGPVNKQFNYTDYVQYCRAVFTATKLSIIIYKELIDNTGDRLGIVYGKNGWAVDHKFSKYGGFVNKIHPLLIGSYQNLQLLPKVENIRKGQYCSITLDELNSYKTILDDTDISTVLKGKINEIFIEQS